MSTTVTYKGSSIAAFENTTKTLNTSGTWLEDNITITDVTSGGGDTSIEDGLVERTLSYYENSRVSTIGSNAFYANKVIQSVNFQSVTSIGQAAFSGCTGLMSYSFPECIDIGAYAFSSCALTIAYFPKCTSVGTFAFNLCSITTVSFPEIKNVGSQAFTTCRSIISVSLPNALSIYASAFQGAWSLSDLYIPKCTYMSSNAFANCSALTSIVLLSFTSCGSNAFRSCWSLSYVSFGNASTMGYTGGYAFANCSALKTFIFSKSSTTTSYMLYSNCFNGCWNLLSLYILYSGSVIRLSNINVFTSTPISTYTTETGGIQGSIFVPSSKLSAYKASTNWVTYSDRIVGLTDEEIARVIASGTHLP